MAATSVSPYTSSSSTTGSPSAPPEDFSPYFFTILDYIRPEPGQLAPELSSTIEILKAQEGMLLLFHEKTATSLRQQIHSFVQEQRLPPAQVKAFHQVIRELYPASLLNSFTYTTLQELKKDIQRLYIELKHDGKLNPVRLKSLIEEASQLLTTTSLESPQSELEVRLNRMKELTSLLSEYHTLRKFIDPIQSQRMIDLAREFDDEEYHTFLALYPKLIDELREIKTRLDTAFMRSEELFHTEIRLRTEMAKRKGESSRPDIHIQNMLLLYGDCLEKAAHPLLWKELQQNLLGKRETLEKFPTLEGPYSPEQEGTLTDLLRENYPHFAIEHRIQAILKQVPKEELGTLKYRLDSLYSAISELHKQELSREQLNLALAPLTTEMEQICFDEIYRFQLAHHAILA